MESNKINIILDTDTFNECDDQFALAYMLKSQQKLNIEAITIAPYSHKTCNIEDGLKNSYNEVLKIANFLNEKVENKTFKGANKYLENDKYVKSEAVDKIIEIAMKNNKTYILAIGALTNIASAINLQPEIINKVEIIWLGGHDLREKNNLEYNFKQDVNAVKYIFQSNAKLTIIPCKNVASKLRISIDELNDNLKGKNELCEYLIQKFYNDGYHGITESRVIWDISVIAYMINRDWFSESIMDCPEINEDTSYKIVKNNRKIIMVNNLKRDEIYEDIFCKL